MALYDSQELAFEPEGFAESVRYVAQSFIGPDHLKKLYEALCVKWDRLHSLSAAVRLMQSYGVELSEEEVDALSEKSEAEQINELVSKIPPQSNDQFQQFFLQLQLLVSTAMRVRRALEEGQPEEVRDALDDADATGISTYILRVAVVQAGNEVATLRHQFDDWLKQADSKMGRLVRGQQDAVAAQKKLAVAQAEMDRYSRIHNEKTTRVVMGFAQNCDKAYKTTFFNAWVHTARTLALENRIYEEYRARLENLEDKLTKMQSDHINNANNMMLKRIKEENEFLVSDVWDTWRQQAEEAKFMRESGEKLRALEDRLANSKASQRESAKKVMSSFNAASERGLMELYLKTWVDVKAEADLERVAEKAKAEAQSRMDQFLKDKNESGKRVLQIVSSCTDSGRLGECFKGWMHIIAEVKRENYLSASLAEKNSMLSGFAFRNKASAGSALEGSASAIEQMLVLKVLFSWRNHAKKEFVIRKHHMMVDSKRQQLVGVQQMFRDFAKKLEQGMKPPQEQVLGEREPAPAAAPAAGKRMSRSEGSTSLPDIHKTTSGRSSMKMSPTGKNQPSPSSRQMASPLHAKGAAGLNLGAEGPPPMSGPRQAWG